MVENFVATESGSLHAAALPVLNLKQLDKDPHSVFRRYRKEDGVVLHESGGYFVLRFADVDRLGKDPRVGPSGTSFPEALGVGSGAIFDLFTYGMITADGDVHRRRRASFSKLFAARTINEMHKSIRRTGGLINAKLRFGASLAPHHLVGEHPAATSRFGHCRSSRSAWLGELWYEEHHSADGTIGSPELFLAAAGKHTQRIRHRYWRGIHHIRSTLLSALCNSTA